MAAPSYATDLTDITLSESTTGWAALGGGASGLSLEPDFTIQGSNCIAKQIKAETKGHHYNYGSGIAMGADDHVFVWNYVSTPGTPDLLANGGIRVTMGTGSTARKEFYVAGSDTYFRGGWVCYPVRYSQTADATSGSPGANPQYFGIVMKGTVTVKAPNMGVDAIRYGSDVQITAGDGTTPATFVALAQYADNSTRSWGLIQEISGGVSVQGKVRIGTSSTACEFDESNVLVVFPNNNPSAVNQKTLAGFKEVIIDNAGTDVTWTGITFLSLDGTDKGDFTVTNASAVLWDGCTFQSVGDTVLHSSVTASSCTWLGAGQITSNSAEFDGCVIKDSAATEAVAASTLNDFTDCSFESGGTGHAIDLGTVSTSTTMSWNSFDSGYAATDGSTGNETLLVNVAAGQTLTINVGSGYTTPTVYNTGSGTVNVVSGQVTTTIKVVDVTTGSAIQNARVYLTASAGGSLTEGTVIFNALTDVNGEVSDTRSLGSNQPVTGRVRKGSSGALYKTSPITGTVDSGAGLSLTVQMIPDD